MRLPLVLLAVLSAAVAQSPDPAYAPLTRAYDALRTRAYDPAVAAFLQAIAASPARRF